MTPIEKLADLLAKQPDIVIGDVLVPEQCMELYVKGEYFHITVECEEECGVINNDFICTLTKGHSGDHIAQDYDGRIVHQWRQT